MKGICSSFVSLAWDLEQAGLTWQPAIGDEVMSRENPEMVSILVDPQGMTPTKLRDVYLWLPTIEQLVLQIEFRQAVLSHAGMELSEQALCYKAVVKAPEATIEGLGDTLRTAVGVSVRDLIMFGKEQFH